MSWRKRGLKGLKGVKRSRRMFMCKVPGCKVTPRGCDLSKHYKNRTDWSKVKELRAVVGTDAVQRELEQVDSHTRFAFTNNYTEDMLPMWTTHVPVQVAIDTSDDEGTSTGPKQSRLFDHFKVKLDT